MESAIPPHLRHQRKCPMTMPDGHRPPFPAWTTRFAAESESIVMACIGVQHQRYPAVSVMKVIADYLSVPQGPAHWDLSSVVDADGYHNLVAIAYWHSTEQFRDWQEKSQFLAWWQSPQREDEEYGYFMEVVTVRPPQIETIFSDKQTPEGAAHLADGMSDEITEHGYWGSARDRLPAAQCHTLEGSTEALIINHVGKRTLISGHHNLCLIRSGQDWSMTQAEERVKYLTEVEPILREGMNFLRDQGHTAGCLSCRYMTLLDPITYALTEKTFALAHFTDMRALEEWAKHHPTHVAIFDGFMRYVQALNFTVALKLWHEIVVVPAEAQHFEYINCHPGTGLLTSNSGSVR